jgi:hypothetical protein
MFALSSRDGNARSTDVRSLATVNICQASHEHLLHPSFKIPLMIFAASVNKLILWERVFGTMKENFMLYFVIATSGTAYYYVI